MVIAVYRDTVWMSVEPPSNSNVAPDATTRQLAGHIPAGTFVTVGRVNPTATREEQLANIRLSSVLLLEISNSSVILSLARSRRSQAGRSG